MFARNTIKKRLIGCALLILAWTTAAHASNVMFVAEGDSGTSSQGGAVSTQALFTISGHRLTIYLQNAANVTNQASSILTGLKFNIAGANKTPDPDSTLVGHATITGDRSSAVVPALALQSTQLGKTEFNMGTVGLTPSALAALMGSSIANLTTGKVLTHSMLTTTFVFDIANLADNALIENVSFQFGAVLRHGELAAVGGPGAVAAPLPPASWGGALLLGLVAAARWIKKVRAVS